MVVVGVVLEDGHRAEDRRRQRGQERDGGDESLAGALAEQPVQQEAEERQDGDEPEVVEHACGSAEC